MGLMDENLDSYGLSDYNSTTVNLNLTESDYTPYDQRPETYLVPALFVLIFIVGFLGNSTIIIVFLKHPSMRNVPNTYIFSLALGDLLVILICVPLAAIPYIYEYWPMGELLCCITEFLKDLSIGVSVFTLTALATDRYCAIVLPLKKLQHKSRILIIIIFIWIIATILALPSMIVSELIPMGTTHMVYCSPFGYLGKTYEQFITLFKAIIYYFLPLFMIGILYTLIARQLQKSARDIQHNMTNQLNNPQVKNRKNVAKMVIAFIIAFIICFLPHHVFQLWFHFDPNSEQNYDYFWHTVRIVGFCLYFINSCINPVALYFVSTTFRQHFRKYLCCRKQIIIFHSRNQLSTNEVTEAGNTRIMHIIKE